MNRPVEWSEFMRCVLLLSLTALAFSQAPPGSVAVRENYSKVEYRIPILMGRGGIAGIGAGGGVKVKSTP